MLLHFRILKERSVQTFCSHYLLVSGYCLANTREATCRKRRVNEGFWTKNLPKTDCFDVSKMISELKDLLLIEDERIGEVIGTNEPMRPRWHLLMSLFFQGAVFSHLVAQHKL